MPCFVGIESQIHFASDDSLYTAQQIDVTDAISAYFDFHLAKCKQLHLQRRDPLTSRRHGCDSTTVKNFVAGFCKSDGCGILQDEIAKTDFFGTARGIKDREFQCAADGVAETFTNVDVRITTPDGKPAAAGKDGLIWVKSKTLSPKSIGPFDDEKQVPTARASGMVPIGSIDKQGWLRTGDLGKLDKSGRLQLTGREDDVVKVDGKRVALGEVEGCLEAFPKIKAAQATVITDPMAGAMVVARVVTKQKSTAEEIIDHCARNLAPYKVPRRIEFCETI